ncbi:MAG: lysophospholipid acyltransferase family protein [Coriobacteriales bacterium]|jgi:1-acyl-sn-glycerol-3-phosphate acyltransferase
MGELNEKLDKYYDGALADQSTFLRGAVVTARYIVGSAIRWTFRARYENLEVFDKLPEGRGVVIAGNHSSYTDPMFVFDGIWPRRVRFMAKGELFTHKILDHLLAWTGVFPVYTDARGRKAIKRSIACLRRGENVGIFPEATRVKYDDPRVIEPSEGVALIAKMADTLIVPVGIKGTIDISPHGSKRLHFPKVVLRFGDPIDWHDYKDLGKNEMLTEVTAETMRRVRQIVADLGGAPEVIRVGKAPAADDAAEAAGDAGVSDQKDPARDSGKE